MTTQEELQIIKFFESCRLKAYLDSKKIPTIGWGNTFYENGTPVKLGDVITQERAWQRINEFILLVEKEENVVVGIQPIHIQPQLTIIAK